jgi:hypothetical protein
MAATVGRNAEDVESADYSYWPVWQVSMILLVAMLIVAMHLVAIVLTAMHIRRDFGIGRLLHGRRFYWASGVWGVA